MRAGGAGPPRQRVGVGERGVEAEQAGEGGARRRAYAGLTIERGLLDLGGRRGLQLPIGSQRLAFGVELGGVEPVEQLAEEIGVVLTHLTNT